MYVCVQIECHKIKITILNLIHFYTAYVLYFMYKVKNKILNVINS